MIIGMDFGTTNSGMAVFDGNSLRLIPLEPESRSPGVARTALYMTNDRSIYIGSTATSTYYEQNLNRPARYERVFVGEIEQTFAELPTFVRDVYIEKDIFSPGRLFLSFKMGLSSPNYLGTMIGNQYFFLEDIIGTYLYVTKRRAELFLQTELDTIVLGRPVRFSDDEEHNQLAMERLIHSAFRAGYKTVYLQYEPVAAAWYYETTIQQEQNVLVFDFGGGTLDISIIHVGNSRTRRVIANGGIPIAGDIFDKRIVRRKYPPHFGENTSYRSAHQHLPVPPSFYEAFNDWQELLTLQNPYSLEKIRQIQHTAAEPHKIKALINLITGHYGLQMYDVAEAAKRQLSNQQTARLDMKGSHFQVFDTITRQEFERIIRTDVRAISERLDDVIRQAGIRPDQIDAVIRTGGSSRIPVFVQMLEERFGKDRVRELDVFSSVTSGLGVIAHHIERGEITLPAYHYGEFPGSRFLHNQGSTASADFDLITRIVDMQEQSGKVVKPEHVLLVRDQQQQLDGHYFKQPEDLEQETITTVDPASFAFAGTADTSVVLMTSEYSFYTRTLADVADLRSGGLVLEQLEAFREDTFGKEFVSGVVPLGDLANADFIILISSLGYARKFVGRLLAEKLGMPIPYHLSQRLRGYPAALLGVRDDQDVLVISAAGRAVRIPTSKIPLRDSRILSVSGKGSIAGAFAIENDNTLLLAASNGMIQQLAVSTMPRADSINTTGEKITSRAAITAATLVSDQPVFALTTHRLIPVNPENGSEISLSLHKRQSEKLITCLQVNQG